MEQHNHADGIEIKLLASRRYVFANRKSSVVISTENNATEITVLYPDEYEGYSKRVDFISSKGKEWTEGLYTPEYGRKEYPPDIDKLKFRFSLPGEVTTEGELKMQFIAYKPDESMSTVPFEVISIDVQSGVNAFKRNARSNPDLLILSANQSADALFNSERALAKSSEALDKSVKAINESEQTKAVSECAIAVAEHAKTQASNAVSASNEALEVAKSLHEIAEQSQATSNEAHEIANAASVIADNAESKATSAVELANNANEQSADALSYSRQAEELSGSAVETATSAKNTATTAEVIANDAVIISESATEIARQAESNSLQAKALAESSNTQSTQAIELAYEVKTRADNGEFKGEKGDKGEPGKDGIAFSVGNLIALSVDKNGDFYAYAGESPDIDFRYDEETGDLYIVYN